MCNIICFSNDSSANLCVGLEKKRDTENNRIIFLLRVTSSGSNINSYDGNFTITFTVTKIEQYIDN